MKFKVKNTLRYEFMIKKNVNKIEIEIDGKKYQTDVDYDIEKGDHQVNVDIEYTDGSHDVFKNQRLTVKKKVCKIDLYAKTVGRMFQNLIFNKLFAMIFIIMIVVSLIVPSLSTVVILIGTYTTLATGNDYALKKYGFDETVRVKFK